MRRYLSLILVVLFAFAMAMGLVGCKKGGDAEQPADQADDHGTKNCGPESLNIKPGNNPGGHFQHQGINDKRKQAQS